MNSIDSIVFEAMLKEAVNANFRRKMNEMPSEEELLHTYPPSAEHIRKMNSLFTWEQRRVAVKRFLSLTRTALIYLCIVSSVVFSLLMFNPRVRAAVWDAVVQFFEGFTRIEFRESAETPRPAQSFALGYIPEGYVLENVEDYGDSCLTIYNDADGNRLMLNANPQDSYMGDADDRDYRTEIHEETTYYIFDASDNDDYSNITWTKYGYMFNLTGIISAEELLKIARSLG